MQTESEAKVVSQRNRWTTQKDDIRQIQLNIVSNYTVDRTAIDRWRA